MTIFSILLICTCYQGWFVVYLFDLYHFKYGVHVDINPHNWLGRQPISSLYWVPCICRSVSQATFTVLIMIYITANLQQQKQLVIRSDLWGNLARWHVALILQWNLYQKFNSISILLVLGISWLKTIIVLKVAHSVFWCCERHCVHVCALAASVLSYRLYFSLFKFLGYA